MFKRALPFAPMVAIAVISTSTGCRVERATSSTKEKGTSNMSVHYLEIVSDDVDASTALHQRLHGLTFGPPDADLGQARVATRGDGSLVGIRKPLASHEEPIVRLYTEVEDIQRAVKEAEELGATIAYPPTLQGKRGTFAIFFHGGVQHGLWQRPDPR